MTTYKPRRIQKVLIHLSWTPFIVIFQKENLFSKSISQLHFVTAAQADELSSLTDFNALCLLFKIYNSYISHSHSSKKKSKETLQQIVRTIKHDCIIWEGLRSILNLKKDVWGNKNYWIFYFLKNQNKSYCYICIYADSKDLIENLAFK